MVGKHLPVMLHEVLAGLAPGPNKVFLDGTLGSGGHARALLEASGPDGFLIGLDRDPEALQQAAKQLASFETRIMLQQSSFEQFDHALAQACTPAVDGILLDLGLSSVQLDDAKRGFSFQHNGPLDMRMDPSVQLSAEEIVNRCPAPQLEQLFRNFGEERFARRHARVITKARQRHPITTTGELAEIIVRATPGAGRKRIHPATRVFQALRIAVNDELGTLDRFLAKFCDYLRPQGRIAILSYHSLEDRRVKTAFRSAAQEHLLQIITKKPLTPSAEELRKNPRARSAKLRIAEKCEARRKG